MTQKTLKFAVALGFAAILAAPIVPIAHGAPATGSTATTADIIAAATAATDVTNISDLKAKIDDLQTQLEALSVSTANATYNFTRDLYVGKVGNDVRALQQFLNLSGFGVAAAGPGSPGNETTYFGPMTKMALSKWQVSAGINGSGYFGAISRGKIASLGLAAIAATTDADFPAGCTSATGYSPTTGIKCDLAKVTFSDAADITVFDPGVGLTVWEGRAAVASRDVNFTHFALRQMGSINSADIGNFRLWVDGKEVASQVRLDVNNYVTFTGFKAILTSGTRIIRVTADVTGGSGKTVQMSLRGSYDVMFADSEFGTSRASAGVFPFGPAAFTVGKGRMVVVKAANSPSEKLTRGKFGAPLATYTFTAYGEAIHVKTLNVGIITNDPTNVTIRNIRIKAAGTRIGSETDVPAEAEFQAGSGTQFIADFTVAAGSSVAVEIMGDTVDSEGVDEIEAGSVISLQVVLVGGGSNGNGLLQVSQETINVPSEVNVPANVLAI